jgi:hypothetical protein
MSIPVRLAPAPRRVPFSLRLTSIFGGATQIGCVIFGFGMVFFWAFAGQADHSFVTMRGDIARTDGKVIEVVPTAASENETQVMANHYQYSVAGQTLTGTSYTTGAEAAAGEIVTVEYKPDDPLRSHIAGMRRGLFGPGALLVTIFPAIGLGIVIFAIRGGFRRAHLLGVGLPATGKLINKTRTNTKVNKQQVYELTFAFQARDGRLCETKVRTHQTARLEDETAEPLLYDPEQPSRAYVLDEIPGRPTFDGLGELEGRPLAALLSLVIPASIVALHVWYFTR